MKRNILMLVLALAFFTTKSDAQIQRGNLLVGGDIANFNLTLGGGGAFQMRIDPKVAFFIRDNVALGAYLDFGLATAKGAGTTTDYGVGALGRYYINDPKVNVLQHGRLFFEGTAGIQGVSLSGGSNTTGLGLGIGPGYAYFVTPNIGLETLLKYNGIVGFGSQAYRSNLNLGIGFQIYLSGRRARQIVNEVQ
ncbi:MAG TPA: hypothetical protein VGW31_03895 [Hanamia sp.]|jgi:hypothetical protein|nr:hypothetical protein [Hanamia sp.]